jgi:hypothetical protein
VTRAFALNVVWAAASVSWGAGCNARLADARCLASWVAGELAVKMIRPHDASREAASISPLGYRVRFSQSTRIVAGIGDEFVHMWPAVLQPTIRVRRGPAVGAG